MERVTAVALVMALCLLVPLPAVASGEEANVQDGAVPEGQRFGPPPEAYHACLGKAEGNAAQIVGPKGETITGVCRVADGRLVLRPDRPPPGNPRSLRHGPPPEAYAACEGKDRGSKTQFQNRQGEVVTGTCEEMAGKLVLRPAGRIGEGRGRM